jgi:hypothetical protein
MVGRGFGADKRQARRIWSSYRRDHAKAAKKARSSDLDFPVPRLEVAIFPHQLVCATISKTAAISRQKINLASKLFSPPSRCAVQARTTGNAKEVWLYHSGVREFFLSCVICINVISSFIWPHVANAVEPEFGVVVRVSEGEDIQEQTRVCKLLGKCVFTFNHISLSVDFANRYAYLQIVEPLDEFVFLDEVPQLLIDTNSREFKFSVFDTRRDGYVRFGYNEPDLEVMIAVTPSH